MDIWRWPMDDLHRRLLLTIFLDDFTVYWRLHWLSVVLLSMYTVPSWVILGPNCSISSGRFLGRTRVGLFFLLPYHVRFSMNWECTQSRDSFLPLRKSRNLSQIFISWSWKPLNVGYCRASKSKDDMDTHDSLQLLDVKLSRTMSAIPRKERIWWTICSGRLLNIDSSLIVGVGEANNSYGRSILFKFPSGKDKGTAVQIKETTLLKKRKNWNWTGLEKYIYIYIDTWMGVLFQ